MNDLPANPKSRVWLIAGLFAAVIVVRAVAVLCLWSSLDADPDAYRKLAENVRLRAVYTTTGAPTAFRPPLYPLLLVPAVSGGEVSSAGVAVLHVLLGIATVLLTFHFAEMCGLGRGAFVAAALLAVDPILLNQSAQVMTETLATALAITGLVTLARLNSRPTLSAVLLAGVVFGLAGLCRPTFLPWLGLSMVLLIARACTLAQRERAPEMRHVALLVVSAACVLAPWATRNLLVFGKPKLTTTHGGYTVLLGNNPSFYRYLRDSAAGTTWDSKELADAWELRRFSNSVDDPLWELKPQPLIPTDLRETTRSEFEDDAFAYSLARRYIADEPGMFAYSCCVRVARLWQLLPYATVESESTARALLRFLTAAWYTVLFLLALWSVADDRRELLRSPLVWGLLLCFTFTAVHALYWSNMRMRAPLMPFICVLASRGIVSITNRLQERKP